MPCSSAASSRTFGLWSRCATRWRSAAPPSRLSLSPRSKRWRSASPWCTRGPAAQRKWCGRGATDFSSRWAIRARSPTSWRFSPSAKRASAWALGRARPSRASSPKAPWSSATSGCCCNWNRQGADVKTYESLQERIRTRPRTWLVSGAAGFIGSHLAEQLLALDQRVVGLDNFSTGSRENLAQLAAAVGEARWSNFRLIEGDIRSLDTCRQACAGAELVLHQAALGSVPRSIDDPVASSEANVAGFLNMLVAAREAGTARFVYASSSAVYGDHPALPKVEEVIGRPLSPYGLTKHVNELYAQVFAQCYGFETIGLRYFNVFGPRQDPNSDYAAVIPCWVAAMMRNQTAYINGDGKTARDFCYVDNVVQANLLAALADEAAALNQVYNVAVG